MAQPRLRTRSGRPGLDRISCGKRRTLDRDWGRSVAARPEAWASGAAGNGHDRSTSARFAGDVQPLRLFGLSEKVLVVDGRMPMARGCTNSWHGCSNGWGHWTLPLCCCPPPSPVGRPPPWWMPIDAAAGHVEPVPRGALLPGMVVRGCSDRSCVGATFDPHRAGADSPGRGGKGPVGRRSGAAGRGSTGWQAGRPAPCSATCRRPRGHCSGVLHDRRGSAAHRPRSAARLHRTVRATGGVRVLHSRYPATVRQRIAAECEAAYGKPSATNGTPGVRPASILVATQVVEQSLDLDFDLVIHLTLARWLNCCSGPAAAGGTHVGHRDDRDGPGGVSPASGGAGTRGRRVVTQPPARVGECLSTPACYAEPR